jgi:hypothetical protein
VVADDLIGLEVAAVTPRLVGFAVAVAAGMGLLAGLLPAARAARVPIAVALARECVRRGAAAAVAYLERGRVLHDAHAHRTAPTVRSGRRDAGRRSSSSSAGAGPRPLRVARRRAGRRHRARRQRVVRDERTLWTDEDFGEAFICVGHPRSVTLTLLEGSGAVSSGPPATAFQQPCERRHRGRGAAGAARPRAPGALRLPARRHRRRPTATSCSGTGT